LSSSILGRLKTDRCICIAPGLRSRPDMGSNAWDIPALVTGIPIVIPEGE